MLIKLNEMQRLEAHIKLCHGCKEFSQTQRPGRCNGACPCHWDGKDIQEHAHSGYCPMGKYPYSGLGSVVGKIIWWTRLPVILRRFGIYKAANCKCADRKEALDGWGKRWGKRLAFWRWRKIGSE